MPAPVRLLIVVLFALAALAPLRTLAASQATPGAGTGPALGDRVRVETFANYTRTEVAVFSVVRLDDPAPSSDPGSGFRVIDVDVAIENVGLETYFTSGHEFDAIDVDGRVYDGIEFEYGDTRLDDPAVAYDAGGAIGPDQAINLRLSFQLPLNALLGQIVHDAGEYRRTLLDLRPNRPAYGDAVPVVDAGGAPFATVTVSAPTDPYVPPADTLSARLPFPGERDVVFPLTIQNSGQTPFPLLFDDFVVLDTHGSLTTTAPGNALGDDPAGLFLQATGALAPGATASGLVRFRLPDDADPVTVLFQSRELAFRGQPVSLAVAESGLRPEPPTSAPLFAPEALDVVLASDVTLGCEGVVAWAVDFYARLDAATSPLGEMPEDPDVASLDPAVLRQATSDLRAAAAAQEASNPPAVAADANAVVVTFFNLAADAIERYAEAVEAGDQAALDSAIAQFGETGQAFFDDEFSPALDALASACPEINEI